MKKAGRSVTSFSINYVAKENTVVVRGGGKGVPSYRMIKCMDDALGNCVHCEVSGMTCDASAKDFMRRPIVAFDECMEADGTGGNLEVL